MIVVALASGNAEAALQCKSQVTVALTDQAWSDKVAGQYGASWANISLAKDLSTVEIQLEPSTVSLGVGPVYGVQARPCRNLGVTPVLPKGKQQYKPLPLRLRRP
ncbi:MAG: hypothetical protein WDM84_10225 [Bauldia sp.]